MRNRVTVLATGLVLTFASPAFAQQAPTAAPDSNNTPQPPAAPDSNKATQATAASPEALAEARTRYERCTELFSDGDYKLALIECERAYELTPIPRILYNIGQINFQLNNYASALRNFERYLNEDAREITPARKKQVEDDLKVLRTRTATLLVKSTVPGAEVLVDDLPYGTAGDNKTILTDAGSRKIVVQKEGFVTFTRVVRLAGGDSITVEAELREIAKPRLAERPPGTSPLLIAGWAGTATLAGGAILTGVLALDRKSTANELANPSAPEASAAAAREQSSAYESAKSSMKTFSIVSDVMTVAALGLGGVSLYFTIRGGKEKGQATSRIDLSPSATGAVLRGAF